MNYTNLVTENNALLLSESGEELVFLNQENYNAWLQDSSANRCLLVVMKGYNGTSEETFYFSSKEYATKPTDSPSSWQFDPRLAGNPSLTRSIPFFGEKGDYKEGDIDLVNNDGGLDNWLNYSFAGRSIVKYLGDPSWSFADFKAFPFFTGIIENIDISIEKVSIKIRDKMGVLDGQIQQNTLATGETNEPIPLSYGTVRNVTPRLVDAATHKYQWHDGTVQSLDAVYDNGISISFTANNTLGTFTLNSQPAGTITCTGRGAKPVGTWLNTASLIIKDILTRVGDSINCLSIEEIDLNSLAELPNYELGIYISEKENKLNVLEMICASMRAGFTFDRNGKFKVVRITDPNAQQAIYEITNLNAKENSLSIKSINTPQWETTLGYQRNYTVQKELQTAITETDRAWRKEEYRKAISTNAAIKTTHLNATNPKLKETCLDVLADANTEAAAMQAILEKKCYEVDIELLDLMFLFNPGDIIELKYNGLGLENGRKMQILEVSDYELSNENRIKAWYYV